jgi:predicted permease
LFGDEAADRQRVSAKETEALWRRSVRGGRCPAPLRGVAVAVERAVDPQPMERATMQIFLQDLAHALRLLRKSPGFSLTVIAALTLGIGSNVAIFSVVNAVVLEPIPFDAPDRMVRLMNLNRETGGVSGASSPAKFMHWRAQGEVLEDVAALRPNSLNYTAGDFPERIAADQVSEAFFRVFRVPIVEGRGFAPDDDLPGAPLTVVLDHDFWTERLGGDAAIIGRSLSLSGDTYTVIGVVGEDADLREFGDPEVIVPFQLDPNTTDQGHYFQVVGRLRPGVSLEQAQERLNSSADAYRERYPDAMGPNAGFTVRTLQESMVGAGVRRTLWILFGAVAFVLLIACANVANLLLVRATGRSREIAIRSSLGAGRGRIFRQLLTESVVLSLLGGVCGLVVGFVGIRALLSVNTAGLPRLGEEGSLLGMDWVVVAFTLALSTLTGVVFGLVPALVSSRTDLNAVIKDASSRSGSGIGQNKTRSALVVVELGLCVVLLVGAALMIRTSLAISRVDPGFTTENVLTMRTSLSGPRFLTSAGVEETARQALERIGAIPGVVAATATCCVPLQGGYGLPFNVVGRVNEGPYTGGGAIMMGSGEYFETFEIPIVRGRAFNELDDGDGPPVVIISQAMADEYWPDGDPLADRILIGGGSGNMKELAEEPIRQVIGIAGDVRAQGLTNEPAPTMYIPQAQMPDALNALNLGITPMAWVVRTEVEPSVVSTQVQEELRLATGLPVTDVESMEDIVSISTSRQRLNMLLMSVFGGAALLLAAIGIYGLMAYSVQQRAQEIGIRMAIGADSRTVRSMVVKQGMALVAVGMIVGLGAALLLANVLRSVLFEVEPRDPAVFVGVTSVLVAIGLVAVAIPALRASHVDPIEALRAE